MNVQLKSNFVPGMILTVALAVLLNSAAVSAEPKQGEAEAMAVLTRMTAFLGQAGRFSVTADIGFDVVQASGERIEFGETRRFILRRPDRLRVDETKRNGATRQLFFDGKAISVLHAKKKVYASTAVPGSVDDALSYFTNDLGMRLPLAEMFYSTIAERLPAKVRSASYVEQSSIAGVACDHAVFYGDKAVMQLWVAQGEKPLPQRVVITYIRDEGQPQFWAQFSEWDLAPAVPDEVFVFTPPKDARQIAFSPREHMKSTTSVPSQEVKR